MSSIPENPVPPVPPTEPEPLLEPAELPRWPAVIGGISIGWAAFGLGCAGCGVLSLALGLQPGAGTDQAPPPTMTPPMMVHMGVSSLNTVLLLIAGIMTCTRRPVGRALHLAYGGVAIPLLVVGVILQLQSQSAMMQWMQDNPDSPTAQAMNSGFGRIAMTFGLVLGVLLGAPWPIFCLIWFGLVKRRPADLTGDRPAGA